MARESKLTPERHRAILANMRLGCTTVMCADLVNVSRETINSWIHKGEKDVDGDYADFAKDYARVKAEYCVDNINIINKAAPENWQAAFRMLEFKQRRHFSDKLHFIDFPKEILDLDYTEQVKAIMAMVSTGEISLQQANLFTDIVSKAAKVEDVTKLREQLFEIEEKQR